MRQSLRRWGLVLGVAAIAVVGWRCRAATTAILESRSARPRPATAANPRPEPRTLARASVSGTIVDAETRIPIAHARACATGRSSELPDELLREPTCADSDARGGYKIEGLLPAEYRISAAARGYHPAQFRRPEERKIEIAVAAGENATQIDLALRAGGVELTGVVSDLTGGPIAGARVWANADHWGNREPRVVTVTDARGAFSLWVSKGQIPIAAISDGYAEGVVVVDAPGKAELLLTPESTVGGVVIDAASGAPVEGARVYVSGDAHRATTFSNARGEFRAAGFTPDRVVAIATTARGYGRSEGSTYVGLGEHVARMIVKLHPAVTIEGRVVIAASKQPCPGAWVRLERDDNAKDLSASPQGTLSAEGIVPGTYTPVVRCRGFKPARAPDPIIVGSADITGIVWEVETDGEGEGKGQGTIRGRVTSRSRQPIADAAIWVSALDGMRGGGPKVGRGDDRTTADGRFEVGMLAPKRYRIQVVSDHGIMPDAVEVDVTAGAIVEREVVLDDIGAIEGVVVDAHGAPVRGIDIHAESTTGAPPTGRGRFSAHSRHWSGGDYAGSDDRGAFKLEGLAPGTYRVSARRGVGSPEMNDLMRNRVDVLRKPGSSDADTQGELVTVRANATATIRLVIEALSGVIQGKVTDTSGTPISDAFVTAVRNSDARGPLDSSVEITRWSSEDRPVLTGSDGTFTIGALAPGTYTVRAYRKGGGEAIVERVKLGDTIAVKIQPTGRIAGTTKSAGVPLGTLTVEVLDRTTGYKREETFYRTGGQFTVSDLPEGRYEIAVTGGKARGQLELELAAGETKQIEIGLVPLLTLTGRVIDHASGNPVPEIYVYTRPAKGGRSRQRRFSLVDRKTDASGRFTLEDVERGPVRLIVQPEGISKDAYATLQTVRTVDATSTDLGDLRIVRWRVDPDAKAGSLGITFATQPHDTPIDQREYKISAIDPAGPAAATTLALGDVVTNVDGHDVTGPSSGYFHALTRAPPGTLLKLGLQRGMTVAITLAAP